MLCVFFDLDGTLVDSRSPILLSLNHALESMGLDPVPEAEIDEFIGPPLHQQIPAYLGRLNRPTELTLPIISAFRAEYEVKCVEMARLYPGVGEVVTEMAEDCALAIVTSKPLRFAEPILEAVGLSRYFDVVEGIDPRHGETKSVTLQRAMTRLGEKVACSHRVMVGDREHDVVAGLDQRIGTIGVTWGSGTEDELALSGANAIAHSPVELQHLLRDLVE